MLEIAVTKVNIPSITATVTEPLNEAETVPTSESTLLHAQVNKLSFTGVGRLCELVLKGRTAPGRSRGD